MRKIYKEYEDILSPSIREKNYKIIPAVLGILLNILLLVLTLMNPPNIPPKVSIFENSNLVIRCLDTNQPGIDEFATSLDADYAGLLSKFQLNQPEKIIIDVYPNEEEFNKVFEFSGREFTDIPVIMLKNRLSIVWPQNTEDWIMLYKVIKHKLTHYILSFLRPSQDVLWLDESMCLYFAEMPASPQDIGRSVEAGLPSIDELNTTRFYDIYTLGYSLCEYISDKWDEDMLVELLAFNGNFESTLKISQQTFEKEWHAFLQNKLTAEGGLTSGTP